MVFSAAGQRFWKRADVAVSDGQWSVQLDERPVRLPGGAVLRVPSRSLAEAICAEWDAAGRDDPKGRLRPEEFGLTRIAGTMIERIAPQRQEMESALLAYASSDLLCYRADHPHELCEEQERLWGPILDLAERLYGARLKVTHGILPVEQDAAALARLARVLSGLSDAQLAGLGVAVPACGSFVLGLVLAGGHLDAREAAYAAMLDERFQMARWGEDHAITDRLATLQAELDEVVRFVTLAADNRAV
ncbi:hypothetical protein LOC54_03075 [Acetobacter sp. AN02]|uniref:ATP12 family chaperone protein n=1 Tax=Acetobacter sp. AN02 TaxID=2894186 RepID=UPI0024345E5E|nr:ATP12 family protein [Acetobacter sp. AN02]MDG6094105.1 hypothetical protein [Acetobacter sp. AN02]